MHRRSLMVLVLLVIFAVPVFANHSWGNYHWARTANPFTLKVYDNLDPIWEPYLQEAVNDWNASTVFDFNVIWQTPLSSKRKCSSAAGVIEICNLKYGQNGWLGIAGISISGSHITKGYTKLNDTYYAMAQYNTPAWRQMVTCQEIAHDIGLDHQDETFDNANLGSCMDYTNDPDGGAGGASSSDPSNVGPNSHDFQQISSIYSHLDSTTTIAAVFNAMTQAARVPATDEALFSRDTDNLGVVVSFDRQGRPSTFFKPTSFDAENGVSGDVTHIYWAPDSPRHRGEE
jgi:hypothetical protein